MRGLEIWGKRKRMMREFRFTFYLRWGCIMVAEISWGKNAMVVCSMAGGQKLTVTQIADDLEHERA